MEQDGEMALTSMKKAIQNLGSSSESYGDHTLKRFLIARSMDPAKAAKMFVQWQKWRASMVPSGFISDDEVRDELSARKVFLGGPTKDGFPLLIVKVNRHYPPKDRLQFKKFVIHLLDKTMASAYNGSEVGNEKLIGIVDLQQISYKNVDARAFITGFQFLQSYYPERLARCYLLNMPQLFVSVWKMVSYFLEKATLDKIVIVGNEEEKRNFIEEVGEEALPQDYGGTAKLVAFQDVRLCTSDNA